MDYRRLASHWAARILARSPGIALRHADDAVIVEFFLLGTHLGPLGSLPATGRAFRCRMTAYFIFEGERLIAERVYFDQATILSQLGLAYAPGSWRGRATMLLGHPLIVGRALLGAARSRGARSG